MIILHRRCAHGVFLWTEVAYELFHTSPSRIYHYLAVNVRLKCLAKSLNEAGLSFNRTRWNPDIEIGIGRTSLRLCVSVCDWPTIRRHDVSIRVHLSCTVSWLAANCHSQPLNQTLNQLAQVISSICSRHKPKLPDDISAYVTSYNRWHSRPTWNHFVIIFTKWVINMGLSRALIGEFPHKDWRNYSCASIFTPICTKNLPINVIDLNLVPRRTKMHEM